MTLAKDIANAVIEHLSSRSGFDHWWEEVQPNIKELVVQDLAGVIGRVATKDNPKPIPPDSTRYAYEHTWQKSNGNLRIEATGHRTLESAVNAVMRAALRDGYEPPAWRVKPC